MGTEFTLHCPGCQFEMKVALGVGFAYSSLERVIDLVDARRRRRILEILRNHKVGNTEYGHALFRCPRCGGLRNRFCVRIEYDGGKVYETVFKCPSCRAVLEAVGCDDRGRGESGLVPKGLPCPVCKRLGLEAVMGLCWD